MRVILASASPRRAELLLAAGYRFEVLPVDVDESVLPREAPSAYVQRLASRKSARALTQIHADRGRSPVEDVIVLGADTAVVVDDEILGKPRDDAMARLMIEQLSGREHQVLTGLSVRKGVIETSRVVETCVWFSRLTVEEMDWYIRSGEGRDKAGAYAIQGLASRFIRRIEGSYSNVVGLPVAVVHELLGAVSEASYR